MLETGTTAPDFTLPDQDGTPVTLLDLRGAPVVLYFYPKAGTPGCATQACGVRDAQADLAKTGARVFGISKDKVKKLGSWRRELDLGFPLLSDEDHAVAEAYGIWVEKSMYGRRYMGMQRSTFVIDANGRIVHVIPKANPKTHAAELVEALTAAGVAD